MNQLKEGPVGFILIEIRGGSAPEIADGMTAICTLLADAGASIDTLFSGFILASTGTMHFQQGHPELEMRKIAKQVSDFKALNSRAVWGVYHGAYGLIGSESRFTHGFIIPDFMHAFGSLNALPAGACERI